jgi:hypothetical protein
MCQTAFPSMMGHGPPQMAPRQQQSGYRTALTSPPTSQQAGIPAHQVSGDEGTHRVQFTLPEDFEHYDPNDYETEELDLASPTATHAAGTLKTHFINDTSPDPMLPAEETTLNTSETDRLPADRLPEVGTTLGTSQRKEADYQDLVKRLVTAFPMMKKDEARGVDTSVKDSLLETLYDDTPMGPQMFIQAPSVKIYSGEHKAGDMDELVWFGQVVNLARNTRQSLIQCLIAHTSGTALKWITLLAKNNARAQTQLRNIAKGSIIVDEEGALSDLKGTLQECNLPS